MRGLLKHELGIVDKVLQLVLGIHENLNKNNFIGAREFKPKIFPNDEHPDRCTIRAFMKYQSKKPERALAPEYPLYVNGKVGLQDPSQTDIWYSTQR